MAKKINTEVFNVSFRDSEKTLAPKRKIELITVLLLENDEFRDVLSHAEAQKLPEHCIYDREVTLLDGKKPPFGPFYGVSRDELKVLSARNF